MADSGRAVVLATRRAEADWVLAPRASTLGGTLPVRAARSCPPVLAGNAFGLQLAPAERIRVRRGLRSLEIDPQPRASRARGTRFVEATFDTGIALADVADARLAIGRAYNRRDRRATALDAPVAPGASIAVTLRVEVGLREEVEIRGEVACIGAWLDDVDVASAREARHLLGAHATFFDDAYFRDKRGRPTNKYRSERRARDGGSSTVARAVVAHVGGAPPAITRGADGVPAIVIAADVDVELAWYGQRVELALEPSAIAERARRIEARCREILGRELAGGALRYFTTYATAHAPGDPHMFLKPAVLAGGPPGSTLVVDGPDAPGVEGARGVTEVDWFHALPAVGELIAPRARLRAGAQIVRARFAAPGWIAPSIEWRA